MKVVITGSKGYVGSQIVKNCLENNFDVIEYDFVDGYDITNKDQLTSFFDEHKPDAVIHLAGIVGDPNCRTDPNMSVDVNVNGSMNIINLCRQRNIFFVFCSTCSVYGHSTTLCTEQGATNPISMYASAKVLIEQVVETSMDNYLIARFATVFGESTHMRFDLLINQLCKDAIETKEITIPQTSQWRPFIHVKDLADSLVFALNNNITGKYNISSFNIDYINLANQINKLSNCKINFTESDFDKRSYKVSNQKLIDVGFIPKRTIEDAFNEFSHLLKKEKIVLQAS